jgi:hypothetical protein
MYKIKTAYASKTYSNFILNYIIIERERTRKNERINKKLWEELISYFNFIRLGPHRKPKIVWGNLETLRQQIDLISLLTKIKEGYRDRKVTS